MKVKLSFGAVVIFFIFFFTDGCVGPKTFDNVPVVQSVNGEEVTENQSITVEPYGLFTKEKRVDGIEYRTSAGNVVWGILFLPSVIIPAYLWGWCLYQPVGLQSNSVKIKKE